MWLTGRQRDVVVGIEKDSPMSRSTVATAICLSALPIGFLLGHYHVRGWLWVIQMVASTWFLSGVWLARQFNRLKLTPAELYQRARSEPAPVGLPGIMINSGTILSLINVVLLVRSLVN